MKKIFEKPHNLLFIAAVIIFLQLFSAVIATYVQSMGISDLAEWSFYLYMIYCTAFCVFCMVIVIKKYKADTVVSDRNVTETKMWFSGIFLYIFFEILFFVKLIYTAYTDISGFSFWGTSTEISDSIYNLWDNQPVQKLYVCCAVIFTIYCAVYLLTRKKFYIISACVNLVAASLMTIFMPAAFVLEDMNESLAGTFIVTVIKEASTFLLLINIVIYALYMMYQSDAK